MQKLKTPIISNYRINSFKNTIKIITAILIILISYIVFIFIYPLIYAGVLNKNIIPKNGEKISITGNSSSPKVLNIAVIGDSTALGVGTEINSENFSYQYLELINNDFSSLNYVNYGVNGLTTSGLIENELAKLETLELDIVFVSIGANDITANVNDKDFKKNIEKIYEKLSSYKIKKVIWMSVPDFTTVPILFPPLKNYLSYQAKNFNSITKKIIQENFNYIDVYDSTRDQFINDKNSFSKDGYHPSKTGYGYWAEAINTQLSN